MTDTTTSPSLAPAGTLPLAPGRWELDTMHSSVTFSIRHLGLAKVRGRFGDIAATLDVGPTPDDVTVTARVATASIDTGEPARDAHVRAPEFLDVERYPEMTFVSDSITGAGDEWEMTGTITIGGVGRPVTFAVEFGGVQEMMGRLHAGFATTGKVSRKDHGLEFALPPGSGALLGDTITFELDLEFLAPEAEPAAGG
jgi:polyisoprenoid-binding protein YceI